MPERDLLKLKVFEVIDNIDDRLSNLIDTVKEDEKDRALGWLVRTYNRLSAEALCANGNGTTDYQAVDIVDAVLKEHFNYNVKSCPTCGIGK